ncbi:MAG: hypothetical protein FJ294_01005 [Planctomycetes bacterium]|nr:hypothetical protein [Planctomycetota bacterium]
MWMLARWLFLGALCSDLSFAVQEPACGSCKDRGVVACRLCASKACASERPFLHCSVAQGCGDCGGVRWLECASCLKAPEIDVAAQRAELVSWRESTRPVDEFLGRRDLLHLDTAHFRLAFDLKRSPLKAASGPHEAAHRLLDLCERSWSEFAADSGVRTEDLAGVTQLFVWGSEKDQERASSKWTLERSKSVAKLMGGAPVISLCHGKGRVRNESDLERELVHQLAHCLMSCVYKSVWLGGKKAGWIDEGYAHFCELRRMGSVEVWCSLSETTLGKLEPWKFESEVARRAAAGEVLELSAISGLDTVALSLEQRLFAWSYVDCVVRAHTGSLGLLVRTLQQEKPTSEAIQIALNVSLADFQRDWATWAGATYSVRRR